MRLKGLTVTFETDLRTDDAEDIITAVKQLRGVLDVQPVETVSGDYMAREVIRNELREKLFDVLAWRKP
jgi:hypothetical protein